MKHSLDYNKLQHPMKSHVDEIVVAVYNNGIDAGNAKFNEIVTRESLNLAESIILADVSGKRCLQLGYVDLGKLPA